MNTVAKLFIGREERELNFVKLDYYRYTRVTGRSQSEVLEGLIQVRFTPKGDEDTILRWMFTHRMEDKNTDPSKSYYTLKDGEVVFYEGDFNVRILFKYKFEDCTPIHYQEFFSNEWGMETGVVINIDLSDHTKDFIYNDEVLENDIIKDFEVTADTHKIKLKVIAQQKEELETTKSN